MSLTLTDTEDFGTGLNRLINEEITAAYETLEDVTAENRHVAIHDIRKSFKKLRSLFRMVRDKIGENCYKKENVFYRDLGRKISGLRDSSAIIEVIDQIKYQYKKELGNNVFKDPLESLIYFRKQLVKTQLDKEGRLNQIKSDLHDKLKEDISWMPTFSSFEEIAPNIRRVYKRGKEALSKSQESRKVPDLHEWRKRAKYLRYQMDIISRIWPRVLTAFQNELHDISDFLGMDHDLSILLEKINYEHIKFKDPAEKTLLLALIETQREQLQQHAFIKGNNFYQIHSEDFISILSNCWGTHQTKIHMDNLSKLDSLNY